MATERQERIVRALTDLTWLYVNDELDWTTNADRTNIRRVIDILNKQMPSEGE